MMESLTILLKMEYNLHGNNMIETEECLSEQMDSTIASAKIIKDLNGLESGLY